MQTSLTMVLVAVSLLLACAARGQGSFELANKHTPVVNAPVMDAQGVLLAGTNYLAELWGGAAQDSLTPLLDIARGNTRVFAGFVSPGYFFSGTSYLSVTSIPPRGWAWLEVRVWDVRLGATYEAVAELGIGSYGESPLFYARGADPFRSLLNPPPR